MEAENWKPVVGYEGLYEVSDCGGIERVADVCGGPIRRAIRQRPCRQGYLFVMLNRPGAKQKRIAVHNVVARAFHGPRPDGFDVNHKDANKRNNRADNLEYVTRQENIRHAVEHGLHRHGETHGMAKLTEKQVIDMRKRFQAGASLKELAEQFGTSPGYVHNVIAGLEWRHLPLFPRPKGRHWTAKLTAEKVVEIRATHACGGTTQAAIARRFGVSASIISDIITGKSWKQVLPTPGM